MKAQRSRLNREFAPVIGMALAVSLLIGIGGCKAKEQGDSAPPANPQVVQVADMNLITRGPASLADGQKVEAQEEEKK